MNNIKVTWMHRISQEVSVTSIEVTPDTDLDGFHFAPLVAVRTRVPFPFIEIIEAVEA